MATSISKTSVAVGMDASAFKTGAEGLKSYFKDIGASAGKLVGVLGLASLSFAGIKAGIEASLGKVVAFEKTQAIIEAIGRTAGDSKESIAILVNTLSTITGRSEESGKALGDMARKMMSIGFSAAETEKMVSSFYKAAKASPAEIGETYSTLEKMALNLDEFGFVSLKQYKAVAQLGIPIMEILAKKISEMRGVVVTAEDVAAQLKLSQQTGGASGITTQEQLVVLSGLGDSELVQAQIAAVGNTFAGSMKKSKEEISLMFFEIGKAINAFFGGTKTYVSLFKTITAGVKAAREQVELLTEVFANNRQWIEDFKNGIHILVVAFFRGFEVMGEQLMESKAILGQWFDYFFENIPAMENAIGSFFTSAASMTFDFFASIGTGFTSAMAGIKSAFYSTIGGGVGLITGLFSAVGGGFMAIGRGFKSLLNTLTFGLSGVIGSATSSLLSFSSWIGARFFEAYYNIFKGLLNFITMGFSNKVIESIAGIVSAIGGFFTSATKPVEDTTGAIKGMAKATDTGTERVSYMQEIFKGFGEYMTDFSNNFQAIFSVWDVLMDSFGDGVNDVTNIWEGMYELLQTIKTAGQVGFIAIAEIGINSMNGILAVFEEIADFTQKWIDKFTYGLSAIAEALGIVNKGTTDAAMAQDSGRAGTNLGRIGTEGMADARAELWAQAERERLARIKMYNERKLGLNKDKADAENPDFARGKGGAAGAQLAAPTLLTAGGTEEYKLIMERNNSKLMKGADKTNDLLEQANGHLEQIAAAPRPTAPRNNTTTLIASA